MLSVRKIAVTSLIFLAVSGISLVLVSCVAGSGPAPQNTVTKPNCEGKYFLIRNLMRNPDKLSKDTARIQASAAISMGCDPNKVNEALGAGGGGNVNCPCMDNYGVRYRHTFGQTAPCPSRDEIEVTAEWIPCN